MNRFTDLYQCDFTLTEREQQLQTIAEQYVRETEAYDRSVCTGPIRYGEITPATHQEFLLVNRNANQLLESLCQRHCQFTRREILGSVHDFDRRGARA
ncbi:hypothetical protein PH586_08900 [Pseudomonas sp. SA3-5]|uniref:Uncharacterized protein n=1 Tax=Pseudomonas aestuarii TaxID=3018340 RepID=A0ABT4XE72_9PSED|nr:hypothetical protein [Pseudomonas aestuarii]MDA7086495.1 hypothetical protein [Pseudomonas aestuarii]